MQVWIATDGSGVGRRAERNLGSLCSMNRYGNGERISVGASSESVHPVSSIGVSGTSGSAADVKTTADVRTGF